MKNGVKFSLLIFFILVIVRTSNAQYSISGTVRYSDNNQTVTSGEVAVYNSDGTLNTTTGIQTDGTYQIGSTGGGQSDLIGIANQDADNFVPTYYPDKQNPAQATLIQPTSNMTGVDIYVTRVSSGGHNAITSSITGNITLDNKPVKDAIIYAKQGDLYRGYAITDASGKYKINNLPEGDYILVIYRIGSTSAQRTITVTDKNNTANFNLTALKQPNITLNTVTPKDFKLSQNYPNPFNPSTVISYNIPANGTVTLVIFNTGGKEVKSLVNGYMNAGTHSVEFNAENIASGIYFYRISFTGESLQKFTDTKRMVLVK